MLPETASWNDALTSARRAIASGQREFRAAAQGILEGVRDLRQGDAAAPQRIVEDIVDLQHARLTVKAGAALVRADREIGDEILNMVRHDDAGRAARDTRPDPRRARPRPRVDLLI